MVFLCVELPIPISGISRVDHVLILHRRLTLEMARTRDSRSLFRASVWHRLGFRAPSGADGCLCIHFCLRFQSGWGYKGWASWLTTYLLSGLIPWLSFQESMSKGSTVIVGNANLVKQVIFPIEILPVKECLRHLSHK